MERVDPPLAADERSTLLAFLDHQRATVLVKVAGLEAEGFRRVHPPSTLTAAGLVKHLAHMEDGWFNDVFAGRAPLKTWAALDDEVDEVDRVGGARDDRADLVALYEAACERSRAVVAAAGLDEVSAEHDTRTGEPFSLRWIVVHMIEETARHNGQLDLIRESIDGVVGE